MSDEYNIFFLPNPNEKPSREYFLVIIDAPQNEYLSLTIICLDSKIEPEELSCLHFHQSQKPPPSLPYPMTPVISSRKKMKTRWKEKVSMRQGQILLAKLHLELDPSSPGYCYDPASS